jgi:hypothetical protein
MEYYVASTTMILPIPAATVLSIAPHPSLISQAQTHAVILHTLPNFLLFATIFDRTIYSPKTDD